MSCRIGLQWSVCLAVAAGVMPGAPANLARAEAPPVGFTALFNGENLDGWYGLPGTDPRKLAAMTAEERAALLAKHEPEFKAHWRVENGELVNDGFGPYATSAAEFGDYELWIDYKTVPKADSGIYLKGTPQVQIWDPTDEGLFKHGADKGSGGLWNNSPGAPGKDPLVRADRPFGEWNRFRIRQLGSRTWVWLNDQLVVDGAIMENLWDRKMPLVARGPIQLQTHGGEIRWRNIFVREIPSDEANRLLRGEDSPEFVQLFNGQDLSGWAGDTQNCEVVDGAIVCKKGKGGNLYTADQYENFVVRLEFQLPPGANNGLAIRYPGKGNPAYDGMCELQVLDDSHEKYAKLDPRQVHGSAYGIVGAHRGYLRPLGQWNYQEVTVRGSTIRVELNGSVILDADLAKITEFMDNKPHPGKDLTKGHFGFAGHGDDVRFRKIAIRPLP